MKTLHFNDLIIIHWSVKSLAGHYIAMGVQMVWRKNGVRNGMKNGGRNGMENGARNGMENGGRNGNQSTFPIQNVKLRWTVIPCCLFVSDHKLLEQFQCLKSI